MSDTEDMIENMGINMAINMGINMGINRPPEAYSETAVKRGGKTSHKQAVDLSVDQCDTNKLVDQFGNASDHLFCNPFLTKLRKIEFENNVNCDIPHKFYDKNGEPMTGITKTTIEYKQLVVL